MTEDDEIDRAVVVGNYKHGSIKCVKLTRFLTYSNVEFNAGPRLNMVVGPNGTGKSSILCAICLGLGGEPRLLGRASEVETFIMNGEEDGQIEIEVVNTKGHKNPIISRTLRRGKGGNKNSFTWNGKQITGKQVREKCLKEYGITVDNLCTFLPQDRVGSFSGFDSRQLLLETEKSLSASQHLYHIHQELIQDQMDLNGGDSQVETLKDRIEQLKNDTRRFEREKERMEEREAAVQQAELLKKKLMWLEFDNCRKEAYRLKELRGEKKKAMLELAEQSGPLEAEHDRLAEQKEKQEQAYKALDKEVQKSQKEIKKQAQKYEMHDDAIESILSDLNALDSARENQKRKVEQLQEKVVEAEEKIKECSTMESLEEDLRAAQEERKQVHPLYVTAKEEARKLSDQAKELEDEMRVQEGKWRQLQDEKAQRRGNIFRQQPNLKKVHDWLQNNRNRFRKEVIGPVCCEITPKSRNTAAFVEMHVANSTLKAFVVQTKDDYDLLYRSIRQELRTPISIILIDRLDPNPRRVYSPEKMDELKQEHGVLGYMDESFTAPAVVMEALKSRHAIHKVLIGSEKTQESMDTRNLSSLLSTSQGYCVFTSQGDKSFQYTSSVSKYSGKANLRVDDVRPAKWLAPGVSDARKQQVKGILDQCEKDLKGITPAYDECRKNMESYQQQEQQTLERIKLAKENINSLRKFITRKKNNERKLKEEEAKLSVNTDDEKKSKIDKLNGRIRASLQALDSHAENFKKVMKATEKCSGIRLNNELVIVQERRARAEVEEMKRKMERAQHEYQDATAQYTQQRKVLQQLKNKAEEEAPLTDENGEELPLKAQLEDLPVEHVEEARAALEEAMAKVDSIIADPKVVRVYEEKKLELESSEAELENLSSSRERRVNEMNQKLKPWEEALSNFVSKIDAKFSNYMRELGCTGEVGLAKGNIEDGSEHGHFDHWGIEIRVSFRENAKPQVLSARVQSGGERSVSTIMYLMALQEMMVSPFRCVDEINQGLDDRNERLVFKRIVENSCKPPGPGGPTDHCGQYFLITPKLLPNLVDMEVEAMTIQCIFNGPYNLRNPSDWDVEKLVAARQKRPIESAALGDEENTPNSQSPNKKRKVKP